MNANTNATKLKLIVIGNGMVGHRFCEKLIETDALEKYEVLVFGEEKLPAYDRVHLSEYFKERSADSLMLTSVDWYKEKGIALKTGTKVAGLDTEQKTLTDEFGEEYQYDKLVLATGSSAFVPPVPGIDKKGVFVYRTIEDLESIIEYAKDCKTAAVVGGGLLGLEAAKAALDLGLKTSVVEFAPRLMPRQLDEEGSDFLKEKIEALGVGIHLSKNTSQIQGNGKVTGMAFHDGSDIPADMILVSAGIRPRDDLARDAGLDVGERGGIVVDDKMRTSNSDIYAIGEAALHNGMIYGLVAPGYEMAAVVVDDILSGADDKSFTGFDMSTVLKLIGVDVASFGDAFGASDPDAKNLTIANRAGGVYKKLVISSDGSKLLGGILVGDASDYGKLHQIMANGIVLPGEPEALIISGSSAGMEIELPDSAQICKCNDVSKGDLVNAIAEGVCDANELKACTKAGAGCGGCMPLVNDLLKKELKKQGKSVNTNLCEHFAHSRQDLFEIVKVKGLKNFQEVISSHGQGEGCEICKPAVASILASLWNDLVARDEHQVIQDTNDRYLANIQRGGSYSVIPRVPGGEITPEQLVRLGEVAKKYNLYTKLTGGQRIGLWGATVNQLPGIWEELLEVGFETGQAYGKSLRTVKSCVGSTWCRYGVQDSTALAIKIELRYRGLRSPHKFKSAVSGCIRECAEAQSKDFGIIATEKGWNLYVCGNGGANPRHADLLATDVDEETLIKYIDRFLMYYIRTADKLTRTATWLNNLEGGLEHLKAVVIEDSLGICAELEDMMQAHVDTYKCEWSEVVKNPELRMRFRHFANSEETDEHIKYVEERGQKQPAPWPSEEKLKEPAEAGI